MKRECRDRREATDRHAHGYPSDTASNITLVIATGPTHSFMFNVLANCTLLVLLLQQWF